MSKAELMAIIGRNVKNARLRCGITQEQLAEIADIGASFIAQIESGKKMMSIPVLVKIAEALNVSCDYLLHSSNSSFQLKNIVLLLHDKPIDYICEVEKMIGHCNRIFMMDRKDM